MALSTTMRVPRMVRPLSTITISLRRMATRAKPLAAKKEGDISSVFVSLSSTEPAKLPKRFAEIKQKLIQGHEEAVQASWYRLLSKLRVENEEVAMKGPGIVPSIEFSDLQHDDGREAFMRDVKKRGCAVVRGVIEEGEARAYKTGVEEYVRANPWTKAFPAHDPQVFELYWSSSQVQARSHPNLIQTQRSLMGIWNAADANALISTSRPLAYADRVRIRQPGDAGFALGPHIDAGSVERWEPTGYGLGGVYDKIFEGKWEEYDAWESSRRLPVVSDLYQGAGACSMFRMFQGWLSMCHTGPNQGTLMVNPLLQLSTAYTLLRPFFEPVKKPNTLMSDQDTEEYLQPENWRLAETTTSDLHGASCGHGQELNQIFHPHLDLGRTMVHIPDIKPGDYVAWHCDTIHAVDKIHQGKTDSSVMYIPVCPTTESNAEYLARQRETFMAGYPGPDFPGGKGESEHIGRPTLEFMQSHMQSDGLQAMGLARLGLNGRETLGANRVVELANAILGYA